MYERPDGREVRSQPPRVRLVVVRSVRLGQTSASDGSSLKLAEGLEKIRRKGPSASAEWRFLPALSARVAGHGSADTALTCYQHLVKGG